MFWKNGANHDLRNMPELSKVLILGAGISGLSAGYYLKKKGIPFQIVEKSTELGGKIQSRWRDGFLMDGGPSSYILNSDMAAILEDLDFSDQVLSSNTKKRYIFRNGKIRNISPRSLGGSLLSFGAKWAILREIFSNRTSDTKSNHSTIENYIRTHFNQEIFDYLFEPALTGIFGKHVGKLSVKHALPILMKWKKEYGSISRGFFKFSYKNKHRLLFAFKEGNTSFIKALSFFLDEKNILSGSEVEEICFSEGAFKTKIKSGPDIRSSHIICTLPIYTTKTLLKEEGLSSLGSISYEPFMQLYLGYDEGYLTRDLDGFGFLNPSKEKKTFLGALWTGQTFSNRSKQGCVLYTLFLSTNASGEFEVEKSISEFQEIMGIKGSPSFRDANIYEKSFPRFELNYSEALREMETFERHHKGFYFSGNYRSGISVRECIAYQKGIVDQIAETIIT